MMPSPTYVPVIRTGVPVEFTNVTVTGTLAVTGASTLTGNTSVGGTLAVTGASTLTGNTTVGGTFGVTGASTLTGAVGVASAVTSTRAAGTDVVLGSLVTADTFDRFRIDTAGAHSWGSGAAARNIGLGRGADNRLDVTTADLRIGTAGRGLQVAEGANAKSGLAVLVGGTLTVNTTAVTANSRIQLTSQVDGGTPGFVRVSARVAATSFTITSSSGTDTSSVAWLIVEP